MDLIEEAELIALKLDTEFAKVSPYELVKIIRALVDKLKAAQEAEATNKRLQQEVLKRIKAANELLNHMKL